MVRHFLLQRYSFGRFRKVFLFAIFLTCVSAGILRTSSVEAAERLSLEAASIASQADTEHSIFSDNQDQCVLFENYQASPGKKKPVLNRLIKKRRVNIPSPAEAPEVRIVSFHKPELPLLSSDRLSTVEELPTSNCPRAP